MRRLDSRAVFSYKLGMSGSTEVAVRRRGSAEGLCRAYIDIETTGLSPYRDEITVVGVCLEQGRRRAVSQLYESTLTRDGLLAALRPADVLYSYNGLRFDLRFIRERLGVDLGREFEHDDLMFHCWRHGLRGGLKSVERQLGIRRRTEGVDGLMAVELWWDYRNNGSRRALSKLLQYNAEDVRNLTFLRRKLGV